MLPVHRLSVHLRLAGSVGSPHLPSVRLSLRTLRQPRGSAADNANAFVLDDQRLRLRVDRLRLAAVRFRAAVVRLRLALVALRRARDVLRLTPDVLRRTPDVVLRRAPVVLRLAPDVLRRTPDDVLRRAPVVLRRVAEVARLRDVPVRFRAEPARLRADDVVRFRADVARLRADVVRFRAEEAVFLARLVVRLRVDPREVVFFRPRAEVVFLREVPDRLRAVDAFLRVELDFRRVDRRELAARARVGVDRRCEEGSPCSSRPPSSSSESPFPMIFFAIPTAAGTATPSAAPAAIFFGVESPSSSSVDITSSSSATMHPRGREMESARWIPLWTVAQTDDMRNDG